MLRLIEAVGPKRTIDYDLVNRQDPGFPQKNFQTPVIEKSVNTYR